MVQWSPPAPMATPWSSLAVTSMDPARSALTSGLMARMVDPVREKTPELALISMAGEAVSLVSTPVAMSKSEMLTSAVPAVAKV